MAPGDPNERRIFMVAVGDGKVYSPHEVPPGINMSRDDWFELTDEHRQMVGDRRFVHRVYLDESTEP